MSTRRIGLLAIAASALAGCGGGSEDARTQPATTSAKTTTARHDPGSARTVPIAATEFKFDPAEVTVRPGEVRFKVSNAGGAPHALEVEGQGIEEETDTIQPGRSAELTVHLSRAGTYKLYCPVGDHEQRGMVGEFTVE